MNRPGTFFYLLILSLLTAGLPPIKNEANAVQPDEVRIAVIGDFGDDDYEEPRGRKPVAEVAALVASWESEKRLDAVITVGDNNYLCGSKLSIDKNIGQYYSRFIKFEQPYRGRFGPGASENRFFPTLGNHDWGLKCRRVGVPCFRKDAEPYTRYFDLPGNERYYDVKLGLVHLFAVDSDCNERDSDPDQSEGGSKQREWLRTGLRDSSARYKIVYFHHPPYSSGEHQCIAWMQWPFKQWGATVVIAGHDHNYERLFVDGMPYFVNGLGGRKRRGLEDCVPGSKRRYADDYGAMLVTAIEASITFQFITRRNPRGGGGQVIDSYTITDPSNPPPGEEINPCPPGSTMENACPPESQRSRALRKARRAARRQIR